MKKSLDNAKEAEANGHTGVYGSIRKTTSREQLNFQPKKNPTPPRAVFSNIEGDVTVVIDGGSLKSSTSSSDLPPRYDELDQYFEKGPSPIYNSTTRPNTPSTNQRNGILNKAQLKKMANTPGWRFARTASFYSLIIMWFTMIGLAVFTVKESDSCPALLESTANVTGSDIFSTMSPERPSISEILATAMPVGPK